MNVPPPAPAVTVRADVNVPVVASAPPFSVTPFAALPRFASAPTLSVPATSVLPPVNVFVPDKSSVPAPFNVRPPLLLSTPDRVSAVAAFGLKTAPPSVTARAELNVAVVCSVPAVSVRAPAPPRLASALMERMPPVALSVVPPVYVLVPERTIVPTLAPPPAASPPLPPITPLRVRVPLNELTVPPPDPNVNPRAEVNVASPISLPPLKVTTLAAFPRLLSARNLNLSGV